MVAIEDAISFAVAMLLHACPWKYCCSLIKATAIGLVRGFLAWRKRGIYLLNKEHRSNVCLIKC